MAIEQIIEMNTLFDFYGPLLTQKQQDYLDLYYQQDFSLGEISEELDVSRQAVYDNIKRSEKILKEYEDKLHLVADFKERQKHLKELRNYAIDHYEDDKTLQEYIDRISMER